MITGCDRLILQFVHLLFLFCFTLNDELILGSMCVCIEINEMN